MIANRVLWLVLLLDFVAAVSSCPSDCNCFSQAVKCHPDGQKFATIPREGLLTDTRSLDLSRNKITKISKGDFDGVPHLEFLYLYDNSIQEIEPGAFASLKKLKHLYLHFNVLKEINDQMFVGLTELQYLYIHQNRIETISPDAFIDLRKLQRLSLWGNVIQYISREVLQPLTELRELRIDSNRLICDCDLILLLEEYQEKNIQSTTAAKCYEPEGVRGRVVSTLKKEFNCSYPENNEIAEDVLTSVGDQVSIPCLAKGSPRRAIVWSKDGYHLPRNGRFAVDREGTLHIHPVSRDDTGTYECKLVNSLSESMMRVRLVLAENEVRPRFTHKSGNTEAISGNAVRLLCRTNGFPRPRITWRKDGNDLSASRRLKLHANGDLEIMPVVQDDNGYYTCEARNSIGIISHTARIIVKAPPIFLKTPRDVRALDGETVTLECRAKGYPQPAIAWNKNNDRLPSDGRHIVLPSGTLRILYVNKQNEGIYQCQAINVIGVNSTSARVFVANRVPPRIHSKPDHATVRAGNTIFFQCAASGAPKPVISWIKDGVQVSSGNRYAVNSSTGVLEIQDIGKEDEGRWECAARNSIGFSSEIFELRVIGLRSGNYQGDEFVRNSVERARIEIDRAIDETKEKLTTFVPRTAGDLLALFRFPSPEAVRLGRAAEIFETALNFIQEQVDFKNFDIGKEEELHSNLNNLVSPEQVSMLANLSGCTAHQIGANCSDLCFHMKFRSYDGSCNNLKHPMWGAALTPFGRLLSPIYENGFNTPVAWNNTEGKPSARQISMEILSTLKTTNDTELTHMAMQWGQFVDHDFTFQVTSPNTARFTDGGRCDVQCKKEHPCFPIDIPPSDPRSRRFKCMDFTRSSAVCGSGSTSVFFNVITPRQQINQITSYIDASNVYGSTKHESMELRDLSNNWGHLKTGSLAPSGKPYLPYNTDLPVDCQVNRSETTIPCFLAGDHRANEQLGLLSMHTLWMREHNRIATELRHINPHWSSDELYHTARKIVGAQMQHITFKGWLPKILGKDGMDRIGDYERYNPTIDASVVNSFATAAFRFGHSLIQPFLTRFNESFAPTKEGHLPLHKAFFSPNRLLSEGGIDPLIRGLFVTAAKERRDTDQVMNTELTNRLFQMAHDIALDLAALNIQRGRDHALPGYNNWREFCNLPLAATFDDLKKEIPSEEIRRKLKKLYGHPDNIDLFVGGMVEDVIPGTRLGPLFMCLITTQFKRIRDGDRFWYENPGIFEPAQLTQIKQSSLARVICDNSDNIKKVQKDVFKVVQSHAEYLPCEQIPVLDISFWKVCCDDKDSCSNRDRSFTISNFLRNDDNHRRSKRSVNVEMNMSNKTFTDVNLESEERVEEEEEPKHEEHLADSSLQKRVDRLESVVMDIAATLSDIQNQIKGIKKSLKSIPKRKRKHCVDGRGQKWKTNEVWKAKDGKTCICLEGKIRCKD